MTDVLLAATLSVAIAVLDPARAAAQPPRPSTTQPSGPPRAAAPIDLTGYWVSVVTEDWRYRMVTPPKGDYASVPLNDEARKIADAWDPAKDEASGNQCKAYGAANIMRVPGRLHITWQDDNTLKIETDAGSQTRLLRFDESQPAGGEQEWQGYSVAAWERAGGGRGAPGGAARDGVGVARGRDGRGEPGRRDGPQPAGGSLKVVTTHMKPGYLRKNGVPYSDNAVVTEYFDRHTETNGDEWFTVTTIVEDPKYLNQPFITSTHFKRERDAAKWNPTPCEVQ